MGCGVGDFSTLAPPDTSGDDRGLQVIRWNGKRRNGDTNGGVADKNGWKGMGRRGPYFSSFQCEDWLKNLCTLSHTTFLISASLNPSCHIRSTVFGTASGSL